MPSRARASLPAREARRLHQLLRLDEPVDLAEQGDVLGDVARQLLELRVRLAMEEEGGGVSPPGEEVCAGR